MLKGYIAYVVFFICIAGSIIDDSRIANYYWHGELSHHLMTLPVGIVCLIVLCALFLLPNRHKR
jgi:uncharacterized membrane protein